MPEGISVVVVLAHLMDRKGALGEESIARIQAALEQDKNSKFDYIITTGWNYRKDSRLMIGEVMAENLVGSYGVHQSRIIIDTNSRDTVGDAFFIRRRLREFSVREIMVVTSDYHVKRTSLIFQKFFTPKTKVKTIGAKTSGVNRDSLDRHENLSIRAFSQTFDAVDFSSDKEVQSALSTKHPFYNGKIYKKLKTLDT